MGVRASEKQMRVSEGKKGEVKNREPEREERRGMDGSEGVRGVGLYTFYGKRRKEVRERRTVKSSTRMEDKGGSERQKMEEPLVSARWKTGKKHCDIVTAATSLLSVERGQSGENESAKIGRPKKHRQVPSGNHVTA